MSLLYKEDWDEAKERYRAWWAGEAIGRCGLAVTAPKDRPPDVPEPIRPDTVEAFWTDLDYITAVNGYRLGRTYHGGEAVPLWHGGFPGNKSLPVFLGCPITLDWRTGWVEPIVTGDDLSGVFALELDDDEPHFRFACELLQRGVQEAAGKALVATGAFGGTGDTLASLRGTQRLLYDVTERPDQVRDAERHLIDLWCQVFERFYRIVCETNDGSAGWFPMWSPGRFYATHNDFAYMISPAMFGDVFMPALECQLAFLDHAVHHVDGLGNFNHVDALCELPDLQALQILPGAGKPSPLHYMDLLQRVQAKGKNLHITIPADEVETALEHLSARGLFIHTSCTTEHEARDLLRHAETWSRDRRVG